MDLKVLFAIIISFLVTCVCLFMLRHLAFRIGLLDHPDERKQHHGKVPLIGGLSIMCGLGFSSLFVHQSLSDYRSLIAGSLVLVFVGVLDDFQELSSKSRFVAEIISGLLMTLWGGVILVSFGDLFGLGVVSFPFIVAICVTIFASVGIINAVNMTDGIDGLAGSLALSQLVCLFYLACISGHTLDVVVLGLYIAALLGFLVFNFPIPGRKQAAAFLGDAGSMFLGFGLVWFLVKMSQGLDYKIHPVTCLWIMAVPLFETGCAITRRLLEKRSPFEADRDHVHHIFLRLGWSSLPIVLAVTLFSFMMGFVGIYLDLHGLSEDFMFLIFVILSLVYLALMSMLNKRSYKVSR